jgi:sirohydrochlorin cobaltochelatase
VKKAILVVSFGTTHEDTRRATIDKIEERVKESFSDYEVRRAFTAHIVIKVLKNRDGIIVDTPEEAMDKLIKEGYEDIILQPLHMIPGLEYDYVTEIVKHYEKENPKVSIKLGRPVLYYKGFEEDHPDDYTIMIEAIKHIITDEKTVLLMGHGTMHPSNACYVCLRDVLKSHNFDNTYIACVEGYPTIEEIIKVLKKDNRTNLKLVPLMLVAGDHAKNDMAGEDEDSWKNILLKEGFEVETYLKGLGEIKEFQDIYIQHIDDVINNRYENLGKNMKGKNLKIGKK